MIYTDEENVRWWASLSKLAKFEILGLMLDKMLYNKHFARNLIFQLEKERPFSPKQIEAIRKWSR